MGVVCVRVCVRVGYQALSTEKPAARGSGAQRRPALFRVLDCGPGLFLGRL